jgi:hypothetical protein
MTDSLADLFATDPLQLTLKRREAREQGLPDPLLPLIERLRAARAQFMLGQKTAGAMKNVAPKGEKGKLSLEDLGL